MRAVNLLPRDADVGGPSGKRLPLVVTIGLVAAVTLFAGSLACRRRLRRTSAAAISS